MTEDDLERSLRSGYRDMVDGDAPGSLRATVSGIPDLVPGDGKTAVVARLMPFALAATAAAVSLVIGIVWVVTPSPNIRLPSGTVQPTGEASVSAEATSETRTGAAEFVKLLRFFTVDYDVHESPQGLRDDSDLVVVGRFASVTGGRAIHGIGSHATFAVDVDRVLAGSAEYLVGGQVFLELQASGPREIERSRVDDYRENLPTGRVLVFLGDRSDVEGTGETGAPDGAPIFALSSPMGLIMEDGGRLIGGYVDLGDAPPAWVEETTFDGFVAAIDGAGLTRGEAIDVAHTEAPQTVDREVLVAESGPLAEVWEDGMLRDWAQALPRDQLVWYLYFQDAELGTIVVLDYQSGIVYEVIDLIR